MKTSRCPGINRKLALRAMRRAAWIKKRERLAEEKARVREQMEVEAARGKQMKSISFVDRIRTPKPRVYMVGDVLRKALEAANALQRGGCFNPVPTIGGDRIRKR